jgi:riboflavin synthase
MFTGIITKVGRLKEKNNSLYTFSADQAFCRMLANGTSVAINGACFTVVDLPDDTIFSVEIMPESQRKTMLGTLHSGDEVNLELPATAEMFLSGHIVQGHVDGTGEIISIEKDGISKIVTISLPNDLNKYVVQKGSIAVNGISLTVIDVDEKSFSVGIIPFTWENTMLPNIKIGDLVNIESDIFARYVEKLTVSKGRN